MGRGKSRRSLELIEASIEILEEIQPATVRAVCYRLFTRGLISSMSKNETNKVSRQLTDAREAGDLPWEWIVDETRDIESVATWDDPVDFARAVTSSYRRNKWAAQPIRIEAWSEKGTVRGTLAPVLNAFEISFRVMHGYASATAVNQIVETSRESSQPLRVLYVGDWDPSGMHMSELDLPTRLEAYGAVIDNIQIVRLALSGEDVADEELPSFGAETKRGDPRWRWFVNRYGDRCWELDALSPVILRDRVRAAIVAELDVASWNRYVEAERLERESIEGTVRTWNAISMPPASEWAPA